MSEGPKFTENVHKGDASKTTIVNTPEGRTALKELRYVLYSEERGVYLGGVMEPLWSKVDPKGVSTAPTYVAGTDPKGLEHSQTFPADAKLVQCFPSLTGKRASLDDIANAALPRWNP